MSRLSPAKRRARASDIRFTNTIAMTVGAFILCWGPFLFALLVVSYTEDIFFFYKSEFRLTFYVFAICFAHLNSAVNPFIYAYRMKNVREKMKCVIRPGSWCKASQ
jgi:7 transmembrane receptor (rhodopsin family)